MQVDRFFGSLIAVSIGCLALADGCKPTPTSNGESRVAGVEEHKAEASPPTDGADAPTGNAQARADAADEAAPPPNPSVNAVGTDSAEESTAPVVPTGREEPAGTASKLGNVERLILDAWARHGSLSVDFTTIFEPLDKREFLTKDRQNGEGKRDSIILPDGREKLRSKVGYILMLMHMEGDDPDDETFYMTGTRVSKFSDGSIVYTHEQNKLGEAVSKAPAVWPHVDFIGGPGLVQMILSLHNLIPLADEDVDRSPCYVFRGTTSDQRLHFRFWIDKATGLRRKFEIFNRIERNRFEVKLTRIETGVTFPEGHFEPVLPANIEVQDLTVPGAVYRMPGSEQSSTENSNGE